MNIQTGIRLNSQHFSELTRSLLASPEVAARATLLADAMRKALGEVACALYSLRDGSWVPLGVSDEISVVDSVVGADARLFAPLLQSPGPVVYPAGELAREDYTHIHVLRTIRSIGYMPLLRDGQPVGAFEIVSFSEPLYRPPSSFSRGIRGAGGDCP